MRKFRHRASTTSSLAHCPEWGGNLGDIDFDTSSHYIKPTENQANSWEEPGRPTSKTLDKLGS